jgi:hypothetical protein
MAFHGGTNGTPRAVETFILISVACMMGVCLDILVQAYSTGILRPSWIPNAPHAQSAQVSDGGTGMMVELKHIDTPSRQFIPAPPMISHASFGPPGLFSSLSHALDPIPPLEPHRVPRVSSSDPNSAPPPLPDLPSEEPPPLPLQTQQQHTSTPHTSWSWGNYTFPPRDIWPQCSSLPNCLKFNIQVKGCEKWKQVGSYPILVGDMDGSGSRGITWLLRAGGVWMRTTNEWLDWAKDEHPLSNALMQSTHSLDYQVKQLPKDLRARAETQVKGVLAEFTNVAQTQLGKWQSRTLKPWEHGLDAATCPRRIGWKHGPTLFLQPIYNHVTGGKFTFVHLIR